MPSAATSTRSLPGTPNKPPSSFAATARQYSTSLQHYATCALLVIIVVFGLWLHSTSSSPDPRAGPFSQPRQTAVPTSVPDHTTQPHVREAFEQHVAALNSRTTAKLQDALSALDQYRPFLLFPNLPHVLAEQGKWETTLSDWSAQKQTRLRALQENVGEAPVPDDEAAPAATPTKTDGEPEAPETRVITISDLEGMERAVTFLRLGLSKLQSLFTIISSDDTLTESRRFELLDRLGVHRHSAIVVGNYLCAPLDHAAPKSSKSVTVEDLALREPGTQTKDLEIALGLPSVVVVARSRGGATEEEEVKLSDAPELAERVRDLQRKLLYTCHVFRTRQRVGTRAIHSLFEEMKEKKKFLGTDQDF